MGNEERFISGFNPPLTPEQRAREDFYKETMDLIKNPESAESKPITPAMMKYLTGGMEGGPQTQEELDAYLKESRQKMMEAWARYQKLNNQSNLEYLWDRIKSFFGI